MAYHTNGPRAAPAARRPADSLTHCCNAPMGLATTAEDARLGVLRLVCPYCGRQEESAAPGPEPEPDPEPCVFAAGSAGKLACLEYRASAGYSLFGPLDAAGAGRAASGEAGPPGTGRRYTGVYRCRGGHDGTRWRARLHLGGRLYASLGYHLTEALALAAVAAERARRGLSCT